MKYFKHDGSDLANNKQTLLCPLVENVNRIVNSVPSAFDLECTKTADETSADADGRMSNGQKQRVSSRRHSMSKPIVWLKIKLVWYVSNSKGSLICTWNSSRGETLSSIRPSGVKFLKIPPPILHLSYNTLQTKEAVHIATSSI